MKINGTPAPDVQAATTKPVREANAPEAVKATTSQSPKRRDSVEISDAARALAGQGMSSADRTAQIRQRILDGAYNTTEIIDTVARRILQRGDL